MTVQRSYSAEESLLLKAAGQRGCEWSTGDRQQGTGAAPAGFCRPGEREPELAGRTSPAGLWAKGLAFSGPGSSRNEGDLEIGARCLESERQGLGLQTPPWQQALPVLQLAVHL